MKGLESFPEWKYFPEFLFLIFFFPLPFSLLFGFPGAPGVQAGGSRWDVAPPGVIPAAIAELRERLRGPTRCRETQGWQPRRDDSPERTRSQARDGPTGGTKRSAGYVLLRKRFPTINRVAPGVQREKHARFRSRSFRNFSN